MRIRKVITSYGSLVAVPVFLAITMIVASHILFSRSLDSFFMAPRLLEIDPPKASERIAKVGETIIGRFQVRNVSHHDVKILGANVSCGCTVIMNSFPIAISPGAAADVDVKLTVGPPGDDGFYRTATVLLVNQQGVVPPLVFEVDESKGVRRNGN